jgi:hypothetical protein
MKQMIKRKDGSVSQRGLWDNIRAAKGSGNKPTKEMIKQEKKITNKAKQYESKSSLNGKMKFLKGNVSKTPKPMKKK